MSNIKSKLLRKYLGDTPVDRNNKKQLSCNKITVKDNEDLGLELSSDSSVADEQVPRDRIESSDEDKQSQKDNEEDIDKHDRKLNKQIRRALGIHKQEQINEFMKEVKIEGISQEQLRSYLKKNEGVKVQGEVTKKNKKQHKKNTKQQEKANTGEQIKPKKLKLAGMYESEDSDIQIPEQSRTIYRNKDGTVRTHTEQQLKQIQKQKVQNRLSEWQKGMNQRSSSQEDEEVERAKLSVWDDPIKRWESTTITKPFQCRYQGYANRFGIKPGHRWDGVIRGNGFENKYLQEQNLKKARQSREQREYLKNL